MRRTPALPIVLVPRGAPSRLWTWGSPLLALLLTVACGMLLFGLLGRSPWQAVSMFFVEPLSSKRGVAEVLLKATPLALAAVGLALAFRANVWNIGAEGQLIVGGIAAAAVALAGAGSGSWVVVAVMAAGALGGMAWASITAWLRDRFNANEILVSLMLVYVLLLDGTRLHVGFLLALAAAAAAWLVLARSVIGLQLRVAGLAPRAARYAGFSSRRVLWTAMLVSGGLAGLAGGAEVAGPLGQLTPSVSPGYGFAAIIVAFVGRLHPLGVLAASVLMALFYIGGELAQSRLGLPSSLTGVYQGLLLLFLLGADTLIVNRLRLQRAAA